MLIFTTFKCIYNSKSNLLKNNFSNGLCCWYFFCLWLQSGSINQTRRISKKQQSNIIIDIQFRYFFQKENVTQDKCICIENITDLTLSNASECMTSCADDSNDTCGAEGRMILHEIGKIELYVIIVLFLSSGLFHPILLCICLVNRCR